MKNLLISGGYGFIGSNFIHYLVQHYPEYKIINIDNLSFAANPENLAGLNNNENYTFIHADISDEITVAKILRDFDIDTIINFAAESHVDRSIINPQNFIESNIVGTYVLLEEAKKYWLEKNNLLPEKVLFYQISTDEVYGSLTKEAPAFTETHPYLPNSPYAATKASADHLVHSYHHTYGLPILISHCSNNYGPRQHREKFIPTVIYSCLEQKPIPIYGDGSNIRDWLYVDDHCRAIDFLLKNGERGERYNIGGGVEKNNKALVHLICELMQEYVPCKKSQYEQLISFVPDRLGHDWRYAIDFTKLNKLGWQPKHQLESALRKTIEFYLNQFSL